MRYRLRTLMFAIAVAAVLMALAVHVRYLLSEYADLTLPVLMVEGVAISIVATIAFFVVQIVRFVRRDDAYANHLRRTEHPDRCPLPWLDASGMDSD
jgi:uncharacterized membrane protein YbaN (DUF454 family)